MGIINSISQKTLGGQDIPYSTIKAIESACPGYLDLLSKLEKNDIFRDYLLKYRNELLSVSSPTIIVEIELKSLSSKLKDGTHDITLDNLVTSNIGLSNDDITISVTVENENEYLGDKARFAQEDYQIFSKHFTTESTKQCGLEILKNNLSIIDCIATMIRESRKVSNEIPICYTINETLPIVSTVPYPIERKESIKSARNKSKIKIHNPSENELELGLVSWLLDNGINCEKQAYIGSQRTDIWIPGVCFLELKRGKVTAKDFCQAMRYHVATKRKIILVGKDVEKDVLATITAFNEVCCAITIEFVAWDSIRIYMRGLMGV